MALVILLAVIVSTVLLLGRLRNIEATLRDLLRASRDPAGSDPQPRDGLN